TGHWPQAVPMPQFDASCADGRTIDLDNLRGRAILLVAGDAPPSAGWDITTILVRRDARRPTGAACVAAEPEGWSALAILVGISPDALAWISQTRPVHRD